MYKQTYRITQKEKLKVMRKAKKEKSSENQVIRNLINTL